MYNFCTVQGLQSQTRSTFMLRWNCWHKGSKLELPGDGSLSSPGGLLVQSPRHSQGPDPSEHLVTSLPAQLNWRCFIPGLQWQLIGHFKRFLMVKGAAEPEWQCTNPPGQNDRVRAGKLLLELPQILIFFPSNLPSNNKEKTNRSLVSGWLQQLYPRHEIPNKTIF